MRSPYFSDVLVEIPPGVTNESIDRTRALDTSCFRPVHHDHASNPLRKGRTMSDIADTARTQALEARIRALEKKVADLTLDRSAMPEVDPAFYRLLEDRYRGDTTSVRARVNPTPRRSRAIARRYRKTLKRNSRSRISDAGAVNCYRFSPMPEYRRLASIPTPNRHATPAWTAKRW